MTDRRADRAALVQELVRRGIEHPGVLAAVADVPREEFTPPAVRAKAYEDRALPIECGQTISQPLVVAMMCEALAPELTQRVLEIGTGTGYAAAVLARLVAHVHSVERIPELCVSARARLARLGVENVTVHEGDGTRGWPPEAPYDAIVVTAAAPAVPASLLEQLTDGGRLVIPVGPRTGPQRLLRVTRIGGTHTREDLGAVEFVPLLGEDGFHA